MAACRPFEEPAARQRPRYGLNFGRNLSKRNVSFPATPDFNAAGPECAPGLSGALVIHTLWEVSYFAQFHTGTKRS